MNEMKNGIPPREQGAPSRAVPQDISATEYIPRPVLRPADLPRYGILEQRENEDGSIALRYRVGTYDAAFMRKCGHALLGRAEAVIGVYTADGSGMQRDMLPELRSSGKTIMEHEAFRGDLKALRLTVRQGEELTAVFYAGTNAIWVEAAPTVSRDKIMLWLDKALHEAMRMPDQPAPAPVPEQREPVREVQPVPAVPQAPPAVSQEAPPKQSAEKRKAAPRRKRKLLFLLIPAAAVVLALVLLTPLFLRMAAYSNAETLEAEGQYASALENYIKAKNYKDAPEKAEAMEQIISYETGKQLFDAGSFAEAEQSFLDAGDYSDAAQWAETSRKAQHYEAGAKALQEENFLLAIEEFTAAGDYSDARELLEVARKGEHYRLGCEAYESGEYGVAAEEFDAAGDFEDAPAKLALAKQAAAYTEGVALMEKGEYAKALKKLEEAGNFTGAPERISQCNYHLGIEAMERNDYAQAYEHLERCGGYSDGKTQLAKVAVILGKEQLKKGAYPAALTYFQKAKSSGSNEKDLGEYIALCQAESYFQAGKLREGVKTFLSISSTFRPTEVNIGNLRTEVNRLQKFADLEGTYSSNTYDVRITGGGYTHYYPKGVLKDQSLTITCTLNADMTVTIKGTVKFYYFDSLPPLYGWGYTDKTKTLSFTVKDQQWVPSVYNIDDHTKIFFGSAPRLDYRNVVNGSSTASSVTYDVRK